MNLFCWFLQYNSYVLPHGIFFWYNFFWVLRQIQMIISIRNSRCNYNFLWCSGRMINGDIILIFYPWFLSVSFRFIGNSVVLEYISLDNLTVLCPWTFMKPIYIWPCPCFWLSQRIIYIITSILPWMIHTQCLPIDNFLLEQILSVKKEGNLNKTA